MHGLKNVNYVELKLQDLVMNPKEDLMPRLGL